MKQWWLFAMCLGVACGDSSSARPKVVEAFEPCSSDTDCGPGLFCAQGGPVVGHCALGCKEDDECQARYGASHACVDSVCTQVCGWLEDSCTQPESSQFESCGAGLSCRGMSDTHCASLCTVDTWGDESRTPGFSRGDGNDIGEVGDDGDEATGDGDYTTGDGDFAVGDGDGDQTVGDGDSPDAGGLPSGDGDQTVGDGDVTVGDGDFTVGDGDFTVGDGDATIGDGDSSGGGGLPIGDGDSSIGDGDTSGGSN
jgi:hypothetical protein